MIVEQINNLYKQEVEDNKRLKEWVDSLADFILSYHFQMVYESEAQWNKKKKDIVREICIEKKWE